MGKDITKYTQNLVGFQVVSERLLPSIVQLNAHTLWAFTLVSHYSQKLDGDYIVKMRVSVSKKKIAPKFAEIFPDVFGNVNE